MTRLITTPVIAVLLAALLPAGNAPSAGELIEPTRTLDDAGKAEGKLLVFSEPPGLPVSLDGLSIGKTPTSIEEVNPGIHDLQVETRETRITIEPGKTLAISLFKGYFVRIPESDITPTLPPETAYTPPSTSAPSRESSREYRPPVLSPIEHYRMFGYY